MKLGLLCFCEIKLNSSRYICQDANPPPIFRRSFSMGNKQVTSSLLSLSPSPVALSDSSWRQGPQAVSLKHSARSHRVPEPRATPAAAAPIPLCRVPAPSQSAHTCTTANLNVWLCTNVCVYACICPMLCVCVLEQRIRDSATKAVGVFTFNYVVFFTPFSEQWALGFY